MPLRLIFMGTPDFAVPTLAEIVGRGHEVVAVYTRAAKPAGRGMELTPTPGRARGAPLRAYGAHANDLAHAGGAGGLPRRIGADAAVVVAYGLILPKPILDAVPLGCFNLHASLLPRWRGAAPINRAIMAGDAETGVMVMKMEEGLDTGPVAMAERVPIAPDTDGRAICTTRWRALGADLMVRALAALERRSLTLTPQPADGVTYAAKIAQGRRPASTGRARRRRCTTTSAAFRRFPGAWFELCDRRQAGARQGAALRRGGWLGAARHAARRRAHRRLRRRRGAHPRARSAPAGRR